MRRYWFRPKRFWHIFAAYYPSSWQGWLVVAILASVFILTFLHVDAASHSISDTLIGMAPYTIIMLLVLDLFCLRTGEYPPWWKKKLSATCTCRD